MGAMTDLEMTARSVNFAAPGPAFTPDDAVTTREREVLRLLAEGNSTKAIAEQLYISTRTVEAHRWHLTRKLRVRSIAELTKYAIRERLTSL